MLSPLKSKSNSIEVASVITGTLVVRQGSGTYSLIEMFSFSLWRYYIYRFISEKL